MKKGFTLIEIVISITFISLFSLIIMLSIIYVSQANKKLTYENAEMSSIYEIEDAFLKLRNDYLTNEWQFQNQKILIDNEIRYEKRSNEGYEYSFSFQNQMKTIKTTLDVNVDYCSSNLFRLSCQIGSDNYVKYYYIGDETNANTT